MPDTRATVILYPRTDEQLILRTDVGEGGRTGALNKSLGRYFAVLDESRRRLAEMLTNGEIGLLIDIFNGTMFADSFVFHYLWHEVADTEPEYFEKWHCHQDELVAKLKAMSYADSVALVDAVERWWNRVAKGEQPPITVAEVLGGPDVSQRYPRNED